MSKPVIVAVSGGFDPMHVGHVRLMQEAKALGDELVVILNNDNWLRKKKGYAFMPEAERRELIEGLACVDRVMLTFHGEQPEDMSVCAELRELKPDIFVNGGDRKYDNIPEVAVCDEMGCRMTFNVGAGGKVQSSSWLVDAQLRRATGGSVKDLETKVLTYLQERGWDQLRPGDLAKSVMIEGAELLEHFQWKNPSLEEARGDEKLLEGVRAELGDVMIYSIEMAVLLGLDVREIVETKLARAAAKYPAEKMKQTAKEGSGSGEDAEYLKIKNEWRAKGE